MPINILYIIDRFGHGGTERQLAALVAGLGKSDFHPHICTLKPSLGLFEDLDCPKRQLNVKSLLHPSTPFEIKKLLSLAREWNIHLVHTFFQDPFAIGAILKRLYPSVLVGSFRDMGFWRRPLENLKMRLSYPSFDGFIANSNAVKNHFVTTDGLSSDRVQVIYNGYNGSLNILDSKPSLGSAPPTVGIVANFNRPVKRLEDFLEAAEIVKKNVPNSRFVVVGAIGDFYRNTVLAAKRKLGDSLEITGNVPNPLDHIRRFDIGVITSETEGFCNAIIEYMSCGIPVVATKTGGNPEMIQDGYNGLLVPVGDSQVLAKSIKRLLKTESLRFEMGQRNRYDAKTRFGIEHMLNAYQSSYNRMIEQKMPIIRGNN